MNCRLARGRSAANKGEAAAKRRLSRAKILMTLKRRVLMWLSDIEIPAPRKVNAGQVGFDLEELTPSLCEESFSFVDLLRCRCSSPDGANRLLIAKPFRHSRAGFVGVVPALVVERRSQSATAGHLEKPIG